VSSGELEPPVLTGEEIEAIEAYAAGAERYRGYAHGDLLERTLVAIVPCLCAALRASRARAEDALARCSAAQAEAAVAGRELGAERKERERVEKAEAAFQRACGCLDAATLSDALAKIKHILRDGDGIQSPCESIPDAAERVVKRAEKAEAIAKAERALRVAERATWESIANGGLGEQQNAGMDEAAAYRALCALGVDPDA
jgi:hypothetical protein